MLQVVKQMMLNKTGMNPDTPVTQPVNTQVSPFDRERKDQPQGTNYSLITELLNQAKRESTPSASSTVASQDGQPVTRYELTGTSKIGKWNYITYKNSTFFSAWDHKKV